MKTKLPLSLLGSLLLLTAAPARSAVTFAFDYSDPSAAEFWPAEARTALQGAADKLSSHLTGYTATVTIGVAGFSDPGSYLLAYAGADYDIGSLTPGFDNIGTPGAKILSNGAVDQNGDIFDGIVVGNMAYPYSFEDSVSDSEIDFTSIMMHELSHTLGFLSLIQQDGTPYIPGVFTPFDRYLTTAAGESIVDPAAFEVNLPLWNASSVSAGGMYDGVYFSGPNAVAANGGHGIPLYSPQAWEEGSSVSHLSDYFYQGDETKLMNAYLSYGPGVRELSGLEIGMFRDFGYTLFGASGNVPEGGGATFTLLGISLCGLAGLRHRLKRG